MDDNSRKLISESVIAEAVGFYKLVVATATLFLGGSLVFWERIAPTISACSLFLLGLGWLCLIACVGMIVFVRRDNIEAGRLYLSGEDKEYDKIALRSRRFTTTSGILLTAGMFFVSAAGMISLVEKQ
jgi:hypothetical protein